MKNTSLKKIGAIALAAVMAVTFAPVASLTAFAAPPAVSANKTQKYILTGDGINVEGTDTVTVTIDVASVAGTITLKNANATVNIINSKTPVKDNKVSITSTGTAIPKHIHIGENVVLADDYKELQGSDNVYALEGTPAAKVNDGTDDFYVTGNKLINSDDFKSKGSVVALGGAVSVQKLKDGAAATIDPDAVPGTTLTAYAEDEKSLIKVETKYSYVFTAKKDDDTAKGASTWTTDAYYAGAERAVTALKTVTAPAKEDLGTAATGGLSLARKGWEITPGAFKYDRAITLQQNSKDKFGDKDSTKSTKIEGVGYADKDNYDASAASTKSGFTYFTQDPSKVVDNQHGTVLLDGKYYFVYGDGSSANKLTDEAKLASSSVQIIRAIGWTKDKGNKEAKVADHTFETKSENVAVSAPSDMSIVYTLNSNYSNDGKNKNTKKVYLAGGVADQNTEIAKKIDGANNDSVTVQQVASGALLNVAAVSADVTKAGNVKVGSGVGYYYVNDGFSTSNDYKFGQVADITKDFETKAAGTKTDDYTIAADWTDGETVYASSAISTTVKGVDDSVTIKGEVSQQVLSEDKKAGTKDWLVNDGKNVPQNVYRLRAKVGNNHLFTMDKTEAENAVASGNWVIETSESFKMLPSNTTVEGAVKVLRFRNVKTNEFLFSTDPAEQAAKLADPEWAEGNVAFCGVSAETGYPVTRLFSTIGQGHLYSTAQAEIKDAVEKNFYHKDGVVFFAVETPEKEK